MFRGLVTAFRTLTIVPVPGQDAEQFSDSLSWFPVVGLILGLVEALLCFLIARTGWFELAAVAGVLAGVVLTRGMHLDGFADLVDGFWGGRDRESRLRIMKDPHVGSFGSIALSMLLLGKWVVLHRLVLVGGFTVLAAAVLLARQVQVFLAVLMPYARPEGGIARDFVDGAIMSHLIVSSLLTALFLLSLFHFHPMLLLVLVPAAALTALGTGLLAQAKIGGITGDVLGAVSESAELVVMLCGTWLYPVLTQ